MNETTPRLTPRLSPAWYVEENKRLTADIASLRAQLDEVRTLWRVIASVYDDKPDDYVVSVGHCLNQSLHHTQSKEG